MNGNSNYASINLPYDPIFITLVVTTNCSDKSNIVVWSKDANTTWTYDVNLNLFDTNIIKIQNNNKNILIREVLDYVYFESIDMYYFYN